MESPSSPPRSEGFSFEELMKMPDVPNYRRAVPPEPQFKPQYLTPTIEPTPEQLASQKQEFLESRCPLYVLAMQCYNQRRKEGEEQYKVISPMGKGQIITFGECGELHMLFWIAQPTSILKVDKSAFRWFCARVHDFNPDDIHVPFCDIFYGNPDELDRIGGPPLPICCEICGLMTQDDFEKEALELAAKHKEKKKKVHSLSRNSVLLKPITVSAQGPLYNREGSILGIGEKITTAQDSNCDEASITDKETHKRKDYDGDVVEETRKKKAKFVEGSGKIFQGLNINVSQEMKLSDNVQLGINDSTLQQMRCKDPSQPQGGNEVHVEMHRMKVEEGMGHQEEAAQVPPPTPREYSMNVMDELRSMRLYMEEKFAYMEGKLASIHQEQTRQRDAIAQLHTNPGITNQHGAISHPHTNHGDEDED